ncbi:MAG: FAD-dependent oxidoreductase [Oscillospiraceae bacterium]|nr:FAD-dependent oxidoreductase [Oscillospiraceae bacterium]
MKVIIVGGVAGGATAAARIRRLDETAEIIVFERSGFVSYANCGLPYYIGGVIDDRRALTLQTPEGFKRRYAADIRVRSEVTAIDAAQKTVTVRDTESGREYTEKYDKLLLSPGAVPTRPGIPGADGKRVFTLRTVEDTLGIRAFIDSDRPRSAVILGGGYIGLEMAENLSRAGMTVTVVQRPGQLLNNALDFDMASFVHAELRSKGVKLLLGAEAEAAEETDGGVVLRLKGGGSVSADMLLAAVGVTPDTALARSAGIETGIKGGIVVNDRMETTVKDIYAVGDAVCVRHAVSGREALIPLAGPANKQGRIAADNICGRDSRYLGSMGSSVIKIFDITAAVTGLTEKAAERAGFDCERIVLSPPSHAEYYPGARSMTVKMVFEKGSMRLLGAQIVGGEGADKRIDVLATAIRAGMRADELKDLELAYAPPYSSAKDPVNMAGFMAENIASGLVKQFHWDETEALPKDGSVTLLDVRTPGEYSKGHAEGFVNIPVDELRERLGEIDRTKPVYVMCQSGIRSYISCRILAAEGFDCSNFSGGYRFYKCVTEEKVASQSLYPCGMEK